MRNTTIKIVNITIGTLLTLILISMDDAIKLTISQGAPAVYGEELGVSFDRVQEAIDALSRFDPGYGTEYSDDEILRELAMWKGMFFPKQMIQKNAPHALGISKSAGHGGWSSDTSCDRANN
ncbi:MAG: hypothetical protein UW39_C0032G0003 [Parcubacteria group bacterium GW2011_GWC2_44_17]|nr:MAG: hypothetical protein UW39_C0032G0003 [Parcubacteria group bacterium GW2011_GWC2_44_17]